MYRRSFLKKSTVGIGSFASAISLSRSLSAGQVPPSERIRVGCVGVGGRAANLLSAFSSRNDVVIAAITDVDQRRIPGAVKTIEQTLVDDQNPCWASEHRRED